MSGVCGVVRFDGQSVSERDLDRQMKMMAHRGPDGRRHWCDGPVGMGALLMKVTWEDAFDQQPLYDPVSGALFVSDARIDNREAIAEAIGVEPPALAEMADGALLFQAYQRWGPACAERLIGDFVFAAWNPQAKTVVLARDHMGQRHLFYHMGEGFIAFATERRGVEAIADTPRHLPMSEIIRVLHWGARGWRGVNTAAVDPILFLAGGTVATLGAGGAHETRRYWEPGADPRHLGRDEAYYIAAYREVLGEAVACRLRRATGSVGLFMSGGFDSAAISALAGPEVAAQGRKLIAAASVMPEAYQGDIRHAGPWVEICRRHMPHLDVRYVTREGLDVFHGMQQRFMATQGPHSGSRYTNDALFSALTAAGARIAMDGHGGDYTLNPSAQGFFIALLFQGRWGLFLSEWRARRRFLGTTHAMLFRTSILPHLAPRLIRAWRRHRNGLAPFGPSMPVAKAFLRETRALRRPERKLRPYALREPLKRTLDVLQNEEALGHAFNAAAHGLAYTQPFHDKRVIELALAIPETLYMRGGRERYLARVALGDLYPPQFQTRRPEGDDAAPDFLSMAKRIEPEVLKDIDRMERAGKLSAYFDFPRMRRMLTRRRFGQHASGYEVDTHQALLAFLWARYIEWFRGDN